MIRCRLVLCVLALATWTVPARGGAVGYFFIEGSDGPHPGAEGAFLLFNYPPAESDAGWTTSNIADILDFRIFDSSLAPVGSYTPQLVTSSVGSSTGATLDSGQIEGAMSPNGLIETFLNPSADGSLLANVKTGIGSSGTWQVATTQSVPEPSSMAMAATAGVVLALWWRKRSLDK